MLLLTLGIILALPPVQTKIGNYFTEQINRDFGTDIRVERISVSIFGGVNLRKVLVRDHHQDTLFSIKRVKTDILSIGQLMDGNLIFGDLIADELFFNLKTYKGETDTNLDFFVDAFDDGAPSSGKFLMKTKNIYLTNSRFLVTDENREDSKELDFSKINTRLKDFTITGPNVSTTIVRLSLEDYRGLKLNNLQSDFAYSKENIILNDIEMLTDESFFKGKTVLSYNREDFADFNNKVVFDISVNEAVFSTNDIRYFYKELGADKKIHLKSEITGTLNDFYMSELYLEEKNNILITGNVNFKNLLGKDEQHFYMNGDFKQVNSDYKNLVSFLPNILGKYLPTSVDRLGRFSMEGKAEVSDKIINTKILINTEIGNVQADLALTGTDFIDNASYRGNLILNNFHIGRFLAVNDVGRISSNISLNGKGLTRDFLDTKVSGDIYRFYYNGYEYSKIEVDGDFKKPYFSGKVIVNDPALFMDFDGTIDISEQENIYDFRTRIDYADLYKMNFATNDSIAIFKGDISSNLIGTHLNNMHGEISINHSSYQNSRDIYIFDAFQITSNFDEDKERTILINSPDIVEGRVVGKYDFDQVSKIVENAMGSIYTNYNPNVVKKGQYIRFNFSIYNKIIEIFYPEVSVAANTFIRGSINSDTNEFRLNFNSPEILAFENSFEKVKLEIDNKNPFFNTFVEMDSIKTKYYKVSDFNLINVTMKDTLFFRTEFKGGDQAKDYYNLNLYHTINKEKQSVVGIQHSELYFKDLLWHLNKAEDNQNKIVFDKTLSSFVFDNIRMTHDNEEILLRGHLNGKTEKDVNLSFVDVNLSKITPEIEGLNFNGNISGVIDFKQSGTDYMPYSALIIDNLEVNDVYFGKMNLNIEGDETFKKFDINSVVRNKNMESLSAEGTIAFEEGNPILDLNLRLNEFNIGAFSNIGGEVITNIRGLASGNALFRGSAENPEMDGRIYLDDAGLSIPYLNVDYALEKNSIVDLTRRQFLLRNISLTDTKYKTKGVLSGNIRHNNLSDWKLDINVESDYLNVLDTEDTEDAIYYGKAFIEGEASITGPTNALLISVNAASRKGTSIKIPVADTQSVGESTYIRFVTKEEKYNLEGNEISFNRNYEGLELNFELDINTDAEIEVILNRETGHMMKGRGVGNLSLQINTLGKFNMYGDLMIHEGLYNFKYRGLISKQFKVKEHGSIVWEGDPMRARLNLEAVYDNIRANPAVLLDNTTLNQKVPVEVVIGISGNMRNPDTDFTINFPTVSSVLKSEIQTKLEDKDTRQTQAIYLLASGGFLSPEGGLSQNALSNNLFETFTGVFNDILRDEEGKMNLGVDVVTADRRPGQETDGSVGVSGSIEINERITVNGKLGVPIGGINDAAVVGDVEILYRVNDDGTLNMRVFNRENDITYIGEGGIGYTQGIGVSYQVDFDTFSELVTKIFKNAKLTKDTSTGNNELPDSDMTPEFWNFIEQKRKTQERPKKEELQVPEIE
ncbi:MAG: translocation/assembly module TamB domain-containing protein [Candidatus Kapabacteria bacterium]|nr:translocation/assembly module TamB domain-containing protein [Candidatus Kapabacteria bacterium]